MKLKHTYLLYILGLLFVSIAIVQNFEGPLLGVGDTGIWEFFAYYFNQSASFSPLLKLQFYTTQLFYPDGVNVVFQASGLEPNLFFTLFSTYFGDAPWLQAYYVLSLAVTAFGSYFLLKSSYSATRSSLVAFAIAFLNFYSYQKFPGHLNIAVFHWAALGIITDHLIYKHFVEKGAFSTQLILLRVSFAILCLGNDLGYVAGYSLTSLTIHFGFIGYKILRDKQLKSKICEIKNSYLNSKIKNNILVLLCLAVFFVYVPPVIQIFLESKNFQTVSTSAPYWANPIRILFPYFSVDFLNSVLKDSPEQFGGLTPGWTFVVPAILGFLALRKNKNLRIIYPLLVLLALFLAYHPSNFSVLKVFPWFSHNRVSARATIVLPVILGILALQINVSEFRKKQRNILISLYCLLIAAELTTSIREKSKHIVQIPSHFYDYQRVLERLPGEAVLDWPFCGIGGNGVGREFCPFFEEQSSNFTFQRIHHKKVMGGGLGRMFPEQLTAYSDAGWQYLLRTNDNQHLECFDSSQWRFFESFFQKHDFAALNLYTAFLTPECEKEFISRFGEPISETSFPESGRMLLFPKVKKEVSDVPFYRPIVHQGTYDLKADDPQIGKSGLRAINDQEVYISNSEAIVEFYISQDMQVQINATTRSDIENQSLQVIFNNFHLGNQSMETFIIEMRGKPGLNKISLVPQVRLKRSQAFKTVWDNSTWKERFNLTKIRKRGVSISKEPVVFEKLVLKISKPKS